MTVRELLGRKVDTCRPGTRLADAAQMMIGDDVGSLAVVEGETLVGIVTERDVLRAVAEGRRGTTKVVDIMTPDPDSLTPDIEVEAATDWMMAAGYRHLPVVDNDRLIGMLSIKDLTWALTERDRRRSVRL